ncbi:hypothetical protein EK904_009750 [Melospiza melodia maxima]|nr:hypothetical protein EK904_009750 [Melospiza melodia maxima]
MASISSMKTMEGACSSATRNSSRTSLGPSPRYFWISSEPTTLRNVAEVWFATALANVDTMAWLSSMISSKVPTDIGVPLSYLVILLAPTRPVSTTLTLTLDKR